MVFAFCFKPQKVFQTNKLTPAGGSCLFDCGAPNVPGHLYVIKEREFLKTNERILKIGKTTCIKNRMPAYPKNSRIMAIYYCGTNIHDVEKQLIDFFDKQFIKRTDIGHEYYEGCEREMVFHFLQRMVEWC
jgi:hypothetical protein